MKLYDELKRLRDDLRVYASDLDASDFAHGKATAYDNTADEIDTLLGAYERGDLS